MTAVGKLVDLVHAKETEAHIGRGVLRVPYCLTRCNVLRVGSSTLLVGGRLYNADILLVIRTVNVSKL